VRNDGLIAGGAVSDKAKERAKTLVGRTVVNKYRIEELIAMGGLAAVFRAKNLANGEDVAIKVLHPDVEGLPELIARFEREAVAGKHILHPNVAAVMQIDQLDDGSFFLIQEYIRGITLRELIKRGPIPALRAARIARELAVALNAAHDMQIVHRDVKPLNVMILDGHEARVQLIDFGLAKVPVEHLSFADEDARRSLTQAGVVLGTVAYMAPETALGMRALDKRADLYALGVIFYEMLAGTHPFTASEPAALFAQQRTAVPPPIAERSPGVVVPAAIEVVVHRLLEKDPDARYPSARAVIAAIEAAIREVEEPAAAPRMSMRAATDSAPASNMQLMAIAAAVTIVVAALVSWLALR
jgi:eukaryotic-like serine/threonine-protein kinase